MAQNAGNIHSSAGCHVSLNSQDIPWPAETQNPPQRPVQIHPQGIILLALPRYPPSPSVSTYVHPLCCAPLLQIWNSTSLSLQKQQQKKYICIYICIYLACNIRNGEYRKLFKLVKKKMVMSYLLPNSPISPWEALLQSHRVLSVEPTPFLGYWDLTFLGTAALGTSAPNQA